MQRCFAELNPGAAFLPSWHIELMAAKLQAVRDRRIRRPIINIPPRHLKSLAASIALPAWLLGHHPAKAIVNVTYGPELSDKFARDCRAIMMASWYRACFQRAWPQPGRRCRNSSRPEADFVWRPRSGACSLAAARISSSSTIP